MKRAAALLLCALRVAAAPPDIAAALSAARAAWGTTLDPDIQLGPLSDCKPHGGIVARIAWSDFEANTITLNSNCPQYWKRPAMLRATITHELGHLLAGTPEHSDDRHSIMYFEIHSTGQRITPADRAKRKL